MNNKKTAIIYIFAFLATAAIICLYMDWELAHYVFRSLIVPSLLYLLFLNYKKFEHPLIPLLVTATIFKYFGDIFFLVKVETVLFSLFAICTFTVAHIGYGLLYFFSIQKKVKIKPEKYYIPEIILPATMLVSVIILFPYLGLFQVPAIIYMTFTCFTLITVTRRRKYLTKKTYLPVFMGTILFLMSDIIRGYSLLIDNNLLDIFILIFYSLGHYYVINGMAKQFKEEMNNDGKLTPTLLI